MFLARQGGVGGTFYLEEDGKVVAANLERINDGEALELEYWQVAEAGVAVVLHPCTQGNRSAAPAREIVEAVADGNVIGTVEVPV